MYGKGFGAISTDLSAAALAVAENSNEVIAFKENYPDSSAEVNLIKTADIKINAEKFPAIYKGLPEKDLYEIKYSAENTGLLLIIDTETEKILKMFGTSNEFI